MQQNLIWFSHIGTEYELTEIENRKILNFKDIARIFDWDNCSIQLAPSPFKKLRLFVRGHEHKYSKYRKKIVRPTFLLTVAVDSISIPTEDKYQIGEERKDLKSLHFKQYSRYMVHLDDRYWIWEWKKNYDDIKQSKVYSIYQQIRTCLDGLSTYESGHTNIVQAAMPHVDKETLPVVYQPAIDQLKNFVREIHCFKTFDNDKLLFIEVSIMFNNEELRRHKVLNRFYEKFRLMFYGRKIDIESFRIHVSEIPDKDGHFTFEGIYSGDYGVVEDNIHGDNEYPTPERRISNFFMDHFHPVVFINTSNHAMGEKDNNNTLWKWEYQPFDEKSPVVFGRKPRKEIDIQFTPVFVRILRQIRRSIHRVQ